MKLEVAGILIATGFIAAWLTAGGLGIKGHSVRGYFIPPTWQMSENIPAEHVQQSPPRNRPPLPLMVVKGEMTARNPNALEAKHALQCRLEALDSYVSQQGGSIILGDVRYTRAGKTGAFIALQQIEIHLPDSPSDAAAYGHKLIRLGIQVRSVERITQTSAPKPK